MRPEPILVTGASGNVGRELVRVLAAQGTPVRATGRDVTVDFCDPATFPAALDGVRAVFLLRPPAIADVVPTLGAFVDEAARRGVEHVVFLSVAGADKNRFVPHAKLEAHLRASSVAWTFLRPGFFAQNLADAYKLDLVEDDRLYVPAGRGTAAWVDVRDVAQVAARSFDDASARGVAYTLTGGESLSFSEVASQAGEVLGRPIRYVPASIPGYIRHLRRRRGLPWGQVLVQTTLHALFRLGVGSVVDPTLARLLGRPPTTMRRYLEDHAPLWRPPSS